MALCWRRGFGYFQSVRFVKDSPIVLIYHLQTILEKKAQKAGLGKWLPILHDGNP